MENDQCSCDTDFGRNLLTDYANRIDEEIDKIDIDLMFDSLIGAETIDRGQFNYLIELVYYYSIIQDNNPIMCQTFYLQSIDDDLSWSWCRYLYTLAKIKGILNKKKSFNNMYC